MGALLYHPGQEAFLNALQQRNADGLPSFNRLVLLAGRRGGKALWIDTEIPTPSGWTTLRQIQEGDEVFDETGAVCRVIAATDVMYDRPCYRITFSDKTEVIADADHQWVSHDKPARKFKSPGRNIDEAKRKRAITPHRGPRTFPRVVTTREMSETLMYGKESNHAIPLAGPLQFTAKTLPLDPYFLGVWLGDGSSKAANVTSADPELIEELARLGYASRKLECASTPTCGLYSFGIDREQRGLFSGRFESNDSPHSKLRAMGLLNNKHIPEIYMEGSVAQRQALLEGLMDTDGTVDAKDGGCEFDNMNERVALGVYRLMQSLGLRPSWNTRRAMLYGKDCGTCYRIKVQPHFPICRLKRKRDRHRFRNWFNRYRFVTKIEPYLSVPVRCLEVDSLSHLFLVTRACVPTHNSRIGAIAVSLFAAKPNQVIWACAPSFPKLHDYVLPALREALPAEWIVRWSEKHQEFTLHNGTVVQCRSLDEPDRARGPGLDALWIDEARDVPERAWQTLVPALVDKKGIAWVTSSPQGFDWVHRTFWKPAQDGVPGFWAIRYKTCENPAIDATEIASARASLDPEFARQEFDAEFVHFTGAVYGDRIDGQVITEGRESLVIPEWPNILPSRPTICTIDPGVDHPFGAALAVMTDMGMVWIGEYLQRHQPISEHVRAIKQMVGAFQPQYGYDRSARQVAIELAQHGIIAAPCENAVEAGIRRVESWLFSGKMWFLSSRVPKTIAQMRTYRWANNVSIDGQRRIKERVFKVDDELPDCIRYACMLHPEIPEGETKAVGRDISHFPEDVQMAIVRERRLTAWVPEPEQGLGDFYTW